MSSPSDVPARHPLDAAVRDFTRAVRRFDVTTARHQHEEHLKRLEQQRQALESLENSVNESQRRIGDLRRFNQVVGHDLRGPLIGIVGVAELARRALRTQQPEQAASLLDAICRQSQASLEFLDDLLATSRAEHSQPRRDPVALDALVEQAVERVLLAQPAALRVQWHIDSLPRVCADASLMRQALDNLIGNAVKFSAGCEKPRVDILCSEAADDLVLQIRDNGIGFDAARVNLFAPFARGQADGVAGHGLGLSIARSAVEAQGGRLWCESTPGLGSTFSFTLERCASTA